MVPEGGLEPPTRGFSITLSLSKLLKILIKIFSSHNLVLRKLLKNN